MPITLTKFVSRPGSITNKSDILLKNIHLHDIVKQDTSFILNFIVNSFTNPKINYISSVLVSDNKFNTNTLCKFKCNCQNFKFKYETVLFNNDALIGEPHSLVLPKVQKIFICKHLENCLTYIMKHHNSLIIKLKGV